MQVLNGSPLIDASSVALFAVPCLTIIGAVLVALIIHFVAEDYRRFRDGNSIAAALVGELSSYGEAYDALLNLFKTLRIRASAGQPLLLKDIDQPKDQVFDAFVSKLGYLEVGVIQDIVYIYHQIGAFRTGMKILAVGHANMSLVEVLNRIDFCESVIVKAHERGVPLIPYLRFYAERGYWWTRLTYVFWHRKFQSGR